MAVHMLLPLSVLPHTVCWMNCARLLSCVMEEKSHSTARGKMLYLLCLELMSYFWLLGGWKAGSLISMLLRDAPVQVVVCEM